MQLHVRAFTAAAALLLGLVIGLAQRARADEGEGPPVIRLHEGHFDPSELVVPANSAFRVRVVNEESTAIEFESFELNRERVVQPGGEAIVYLPALRPGSYPFFDDFHRDTPKGQITAK